MDDNDHYALGTTTRRAVLGDAWVDRANARLNDFNSDFQNFITRYAWGEIWTRPGLDRKTRSCIVLAMLIAQQHWEEYRLHLRGALNNGLTRDQIKEVILQAAVYVGVPAANHAVKAAEDLFTEIDAGK